jgi:hypothetical protein
LGCTAQSDSAEQNAAASNTPASQSSRVRGVRPRGAHRAAAASASAPFACDDAQFLNDARTFAAGSSGSDELVDVCGTVTAVRADRVTRSGDHGYFFLSVAPGTTIEIVSNLDAMAKAPSDRPPSAWPWVAAGDYAYVQGRYYYDSPRRQGIDWTEDDTSRSWPYTGYVAVCSASGTNCSKYW